MRFLQFFLVLFGFEARAQDQSILLQREEARQIMRTRLCGVCHIPPGNEEALKIFNLNERNWSSPMSVRQIEQIKWRIRLNGDEIKEQRGDPQKHQFSEREIEILSKYVDAEVKHRNPFQSLLNL